MIYTCHHYVVLNSMGLDNHRPQNPWLGMVYYDGTYYYWDGERWENWALPDE